MKAELTINEIEEIKEIKSNEGVIFLTVNIDKELRAIVVS